MSGMAHHNLDGVAETLLLPLYIRANESQRPDALIKDDKAVALIKRLDPDPSWIMKMKGHNRSASMPRHGHPGCSGAFSGWKRS